MINHWRLRAVYVVFGFAPVAHMFWRLCQRGIADWFEAAMLTEVAACLAGMAMACVVPLPARGRSYWPVAALLALSAVGSSLMALLGLISFGRRIDATFLNAVHLGWSCVAPTLIAFHFIFGAQDFGVVDDAQASV